MKINCIATLVVIAYLLIIGVLIGMGIYLFILIVRALKKYINTKEVREERTLIKKSLAELLKENRVRCKMTQEFVAETLGVSRQAVSKWENGSTDPSTSNLLALAKLYDISAEELLKNVKEHVQEDME